MHETYGVKSIVAFWIRLLEIEVNISEYNAKEEIANLMLLKASL